MLRNIVAAITVIVPSLVIAQPASAPRPAITGISHVTLFADDIPKSEQFYEKLLGWEQVPSNAAKPGVRFYANHSQYVELVSPPFPGLADRLDLVAFSTSDAEALRKYLGANGVAVPRILPPCRMEAEASSSMIRKGTRSVLRRTAVTRLLSRRRYQRA